jgi:hypothetical protein
MIRLREEVATLGRTEALERHLAWLTSEPIAGGTGIPFYEEARAFCASYLQHKLLYFANLSEHGKKTETHLKSAERENSGEAGS